MTDSGNWRARPIFISSTFKDMHAERDWLRTRVFPHLADALRERRHYLEPIDLRLGVETGLTVTDESRELRVLKVCLDEIRRSRPFLLVFLGDRYGWVPPEEIVASVAREHKFETSPAGKSVTALEIEFGILREDPTQRIRSLFFFRRPLPYEQMTAEQRAAYSDAHSPDPAVRERFAKLSLLKDRLRADPEFGPHVFEYDVSWDATAGKLADLDGFGELVFEQLWTALDEHTKCFGGEMSPTWQTQERIALAEFVDHRTRIFVGRENIVQQLLNIACSPVPRNLREAVAWGACVTGSPGLGKSALFAKLVRELEPNGSIVLLTNAAGGTPRGPIVDEMLRRWLDDLTSAVETADPLPEDAKPNDVETAFYDLLGVVSESRRVVVLLDALDQFEPTPRALSLEWFKVARWPANARIIATALPCPAAEALSDWAGIEEITLPPLGAEDAVEVGQRIWARYHRTLDPAITRVLIEKVLSDGSPSFGNPLWLTLAFEQLNMLDADDFVRAEREFQGSPSERITALLHDTARRMPSDVHSLYAWLLKENEKAFGVAYARGFVVAIALSRSGWRESDLSILVPRLGRLLCPGLTIGDLDSLEIASLRRGFRAHVVRRGQHSQIDFFHPQMRRAILECCVFDVETRRALHAAISDFLEQVQGSEETEAMIRDHYRSMPNADLIVEHLRKDPLVRSERVTHLIGERNALRAARFFGTFLDFGEMTNERSGPTWALVEWIAAGETSSGENANLGWVISWFDAPGLQTEEALRLANNFEDVLFLRMHSYVSSDTRLALIMTVLHVRQRFTLIYPSHLDLQRKFAATQGQVAALLMEKGDFPNASNLYNSSLAIARGLASADPHNVELQKDLAQKQMEVGTVFHNMGDLAGALNAYQASLAMHEQLVVLDALNAAQPEKVRQRIGDVLRAQGDLVGALTLYRESLSVHEHMMDAESPPGLLNIGDTFAEADWLECQDRIGLTLKTQGQLTEALEVYRKSLEVRERRASEYHSDWNWSEVAETKNCIGDILSAQGDLKGALDAYNNALAVTERLASKEPSNGGLQRDLIESYSCLGELASRAGDLEDELRWWRKTERQLSFVVERGFDKPEDKERLTLVQQRISLALEIQQHQLDIATASNNWCDAFDEYVLSCLQFARTEKWEGADEDSNWLLEVHLRLRVIKASGLVRTVDMEFLDAASKKVALLMELRREHPLRASQEEQLIRAAFGSNNALERSQSPCEPSARARNLPSVGLTSTPHPAASPENAARLNQEYIDAMNKWKALPRLKRIFHKKPNRPSGI